MRRGRLVRCEGKSVQDAIMLIPASRGVPVMNIFKLDLMVVLIIVVFIGVAATMTTQAGDQNMTDNFTINVSDQAAGTSTFLRP